MMRSTYLMERFHSDATRGIVRKRVNPNIETMSFWGSGTPLKGGESHRDDFAFSPSGKTTTPALRPNCSSHSLQL